MTMALLAKREAQINIRARQAQIELIDRATAISQKTRTEFILEAACKDAQNMLLDQVLFFADDKAYKKFTDMLDTPLSKNKAIQELLKKRPLWEK